MSWVGIWAIRGTFTAVVKKHVSKHDGSRHVRDITVGSVAAADSDPDGKPAHGVS